MYNRNFFAVNLLAAVAMGQMPRECFYVTEMHGPQMNGTDLISDLPALTSMFKPGMKMQTIIGLQDAEVEDLLTGLQINLYDKVNKKFLELPMIGAWASEWHSKKLTFDKGHPDRIAILSDMNGVCDVVFYEGEKAP